MGIDAYTSRPLLPSMTDSSPLDDHDHSDPNHVHDREPTHYEIRGISSLQVTCPTLTASQYSRLDEWIRTALWEMHLPDADVSGLEILRCKGMFATESGEKYVLQGVRNLYEITQVEGDVDEDAALPSMGKLVFIGKGLDETVRHSLQKVLQP